ncbi:MAG TPA: ABC transporter permease [Vicinamibacterales bacterium]|nr:ABC transporter permease [Vicinamibacterales bacterium]
MGRLLRRLRYWLRQDNHEAALAEELEFHRAMKQQDLEADGLAPEHARFAAHRAMGNVTLAREDSRAQWIWPWLESVGQDTRIAVRALLRQPGFTLLSVVVLGVAIGLNTSVFTVFAGAALRPMTGVTDPDGLAIVSGRVPQVPNLLSGLSIPEFEFLAARATTAELAAERRTVVSFDSGGGARSVTTLFVSGNYFDLLGAGLQHGRGILAADDARGAGEAVVVLSHVLWQTQFGGDPSVIGRRVRVAGQPHTVVGVAARDFGGAEGRARVWLPLTSLPALLPNDIGRGDPELCCVEVYARLDEGVTRTQLATELDAVSARFRASAGQDARAIVVGGTQALRGRRGDREGLAVIGVLFLGVTMVLLLACANVGNLLLARAVARRSEIGVRLSLGAGRRRLVRQLLTEGMLLALIAAGAGLAVAAWLPRFLINEVVGEAAPFDIDLDGMVFVYAALLAGLACVASALAPALHATRGDIGASLKGTAVALRFPLRSVLLGAQIAITVVLLASAGLLLRGVAAARDMDLGYAIEDIDEVMVRLPQPDEAARVQALVPELLTALDAAGFTGVALAAAGVTTDEARVPGAPADRTRPVHRFDVSASYFSVLDIPVVVGRSFTDADRNRGLVVVNEAFARRFWGGDDAVGRAFVANDRALEVIGVARDARLLGLDPAPPIYFQPLTGRRGPLFPVLLVRRQSADIDDLSALITRVEPRAEVISTPMRNRLDFELSALRLAPLAASGLGLFALGLATVGMFGVFAYAVRQRSREIGIRLALGARSRDLIRGVLSTSARAVVYGLVAGVLAAVGASQLLRGSLYGVSPLDPLTYASVALVIAAAAMVASYAPARRALNVNPVSLLREE